jgi:hypothetical protein
VTDFTSPSEFWIRTRGLNGDGFRVEEPIENDDGSFYVDIMQDHADEGSGTDLDCVVAVYEPDNMIPIKGALRFHEAEPYQNLGRTITPLYGSYLKSKKRVAAVLYDAQN